MWAHGPRPISCFVRIIHESNKVVNIHTVKVLSKCCENVVEMLSKCCQNCVGILSKCSDILPHSEGSENRDDDVVDYAVEGLINFRIL